MLRISYPVTEKGRDSDDYFGTRVADPYRWLEQSADTERVARWIEAQNRVTHNWLAGNEDRETIRQRLTELWNYPKRYQPVRRGSRWFQLRNSGLQNQDVLWVMEHESAEGRVLLDPNTLAEDGSTSLSSAQVSPDGRFLAFGLNRGGSDWITWHVLDIDTGAMLPDELHWSRFSTATWLPDSSGFLYNRYEQPATGQELLQEAGPPEYCLHLLGRKQAEDQVVYSRPDDPRLSFHGQVSHDGRYLLLSITRGTDPQNQLWYRDLSAGPVGEFTPLFSDFSAEYRWLGNDGSRFWLQTDAGAERSRIVAVDVDQPDRLLEVVPEQELALEHSLLLRDRLVTVHLRHASHVLTSWSLTGERLGEIGLPGIGSVFLGSAERDSDHAYFLFTSFLQPPSVYRTDGNPGEAELLFRPGLPFDASRFETVQEFAVSRDGTRVPMFITRRRDMARDGSNRTLLYGYGGFNINMTPQFSVSRLAWLEQGGVLVTANLRGGAEYGRSWHEDGILDRKQNVFDDFIACAEYLIASGVTTRSRLAIQGGSNGGLLVGACLTQRPDLFGAAHAAVGVLDMLRYHLFTIGWAWAGDYGRSDDPQQFSFLYAYSPLHNLRQGACYPATLITTGDRDDRVVPGHSFKFAAALQEAQGCANPVLLRVQTNTGHGHGKPTDLLIQEQADIWAFLLGNLA